MTYCTSSCLRHPPSFDNVHIPFLRDEVDDNNTTSCRHSNVCVPTTPSIRFYICQVAGSSVLATLVGLCCARCPVAETSVYRLLLPFMCVCVVRRFLDCSILRGLLERPKKFEARKRRISTGDWTLTVQIGMPQR